MLGEVADNDGPKQGGETAQSLADQGATDKRDD